MNRLTFRQGRHVPPDLIGNACKRFEEQMMEHIAFLKGVGYPLEEIEDTIHLLVREMANYVKEVSEE